MPGARRVWGIIDGMLAGVVIEELPTTPVELTLLDAVRGLLGIAGGARAEDEEPLTVLPGRFK